MSVFGNVFNGVRLTMVGKKFGNEVADSMLISRNVFHTAVELGGLPMHLLMLAQIKFSGASIVDTRRAIAPIVVAGLHVLHQKHAPIDSTQDAYNKLIELYPKCDSGEAHADAFERLSALVKVEE